MASAGFDMLHSPQSFDAHTLGWAVFVGLFINCMLPGIKPTGFIGEAGSLQHQSQHIGKAWLSQTICSSAQQGGH